MAPTLLPHLPPCRSARVGEFVRRYTGPTVSKLRLSPRAFLWCTRITLATVILNILTGAAVRLSGSGLGCPDWPACQHNQITPALSFHPVIEFSNRMVVVLLVVACGGTAIAAFLRQTRRKDLGRLSLGLILGVIAEAVLGAFVVYSKLNPYVVMVHFMVGIALLSVSMILALRAAHGPGSGPLLVSVKVRRTVLVYLGLLLLAVVAGTATTGAGPHAGGPGAKRIPFRLDEVARVHGETVLVTGIVLLLLLWMLRSTDAPAGIQDAGKILLGAMVVQGLVGYTQYFTHLPPVLVGIHVLGSTLVVCTALWFHHRLWAHGPIENQDGDTGLTHSISTAGVRTPADVGRRP